MKLYYTLWVDCIKNIKAKNEEGWKVKSMVAMSMAMIFNLTFLVSILPKGILGYSFFSDYEYVNNVVNYVVLIVLPLIVINYFLIFYNERYKKILEKYQYKKGRYFVTYFLFSMLTPIIVLMIGMIFFR